MRENWSGVFGEVREGDIRIKAARKCITLLMSPLETTKEVNDLYEKGSIIYTGIPIYQNKKEKNRYWNRHSHCNYRSRKELDEVAENTDIVGKLIEVGILELHKKWRFPKSVIEISPSIITYNPDISHGTYNLINKIWSGKHPESLYRLNLASLDNIIHSSKV